MEVITYCQEGRLSRVNLPSPHRLDGLFKNRFDQESKPKLKLQLKELDQDYPFMAQAAVAFMAVFSSFLNNPEYLILGINESGIFPGSE
jgi:hypothetical protein